MRCFILKKTLSALILSMLFCSVAVASPLTDYSQGHWSIDLTERNTDVKQDIMSGYSYSKKYNLDTTFTIGLGNKFAAQYNYFNPRTPNMESTSYFDMYVATKVSQFNILYKLNNNFSAFMGYNTASFSEVVDAHYSGSVYKENFEFSRECFNIGLQGITQIASKTTLWGSVDGGKNIMEYKVGVGYQISPDLDFNVDYRNFKLKNVAYNYNNYDFTSKGLGFGLTYKY